MSAVADATGRVARVIRIRGTVQGVGFRPYVYRLARAHGLLGWVLNGDSGVQIHNEGCRVHVAAFIAALSAGGPPAARIAGIDVESARMTAASSFEIRQSESERRPTTRVVPDLVVCEACLGELFDPGDRRHRYPYINCTNCGPRFSIVRSLPYDRAHTTMADWPLCPACAAEYHDPDNRRFHAQPVACGACGPQYRLVDAGREVRGEQAIVIAAQLLHRGRIVGVKGLGGYHLACDADNGAAVMTLRTRKYRKDQAFAVMVRDAAAADRTAQLTDQARALLMSPARPIVLAPAREVLQGVAPDNRDLGVMLPYTPLHHLLFDAGAPERLVMTSGNRSSEPIVFRDDDAAERLPGLADGLLMGERPIARRVDDSVMRVGPLGPVILRRSRGLAPDVVAAFPPGTPVLAVGGDLKNAVTLVVDGQACVSQYIGDLSHLDVRRAFEETVRDLLAMYALDIRTMTVAHDQHPQYASTEYATELQAARTIGIQHHRAHVASVLAERGAFEQRVVGVAFDGTGYGDDGAIWGGELFVGSVMDGFARVAHLRPAMMPGGDAAARHPVQAAGGFLAQLDCPIDFESAPFDFPPRFAEARRLVRSGTRVFRTTSAGRLFDAAAALLGFTRPVTFEGQAAMWLEHLARGAVDDGFGMPCGFDGAEIDWRGTLTALADERRRGTPCDMLARAFHRSLARAVAAAVVQVAGNARLQVVVLSGGVIQNDLFVADIRDALHGAGLELWINRLVPPNDGGISLGQAALALLSVHPGKEHQNADVTV
jgi:hydrogenase maturation protein HypF